MKSQRERIDIFLLIVTFFEYYRIKRNFEYRLTFKGKDNFHIKFKNISNFYIHFNFDIQCNLIIESRDKRNSDILCSFDIFMKNTGCLFFDPYLLPTIKYKSIDELLGKEMFIPLECWLDKNLKHHSNGKIEYFKIDGTVIGHEGKFETVGSNE